MTHCFDADPYAKVDAKARKAQTIMSNLRRQRGDLRNSTSVEDLLCNARILIEQLSHNDLYVLRHQNIPYGLDEENLRSCCDMAEKEREIVEFKPVLSIELINKFGKALHEINDEKLRACFDIAYELTSCSPYVTPHLKNQAIIAQALIALKDYNQAEAVLNQVLDVYPHDDFCLYCKAEVLIEKPVFMYGFFGDSKANHLAQAREILRALIPASQSNEADGVSMYQSKHDLVWAKFRLLEAKCNALSSTNFVSSVKKAHELSKYIPQDSVYYGQAKQLIAQCLQMCPDIESTSYLSRFHYLVN